MKKMLEFLVRRERKADVKSEVAAKKLEKAGERARRAGRQRTRSQPERSSHGQDQSRKAVRRQKLRLWHGGEVLMIGTDASVQVVNDEGRAE